MFRPLHTGAHSYGLALQVGSSQLAHNRALARFRRLGLFAELDARRVKQLERIAVDHERER